MRVTTAPSIPSVLLAMLLLVCIGMWLRSLWRVDTICWTDSKRFINVISSGGRLNLTYTVWRGGTSSKHGFSFSTTSRKETPPHWEITKHNDMRRRWAGFEWTDAMWPMSDSKRLVWFAVPVYRLIAVPYWAITALSASPYMYGLIRSLRRHRRLARRLCGVCGYDLRASPERCPECGAICAAAG